MFCLVSQIILSDCILCSFLTFLTLTILECLRILCGCFFVIVLINLPILRLQQVLTPAAFFPLGVFSKPQTTLCFYNDNSSFRLVMVYFGKICVVDVDDA